MHGRGRGDLTQQVNRRLRRFENNEQSAADRKRPRWTKNALEWEREKQRTAVYQSMS